MDESFGLNDNVGELVQAEDVVLHGVRGDVLRHRGDAGEDVGTKQEDFLVVGRLLSEAADIGHRQMVELLDALHRGGVLQDLLLLFRDGVEPLVVLVLDELLGGGVGTDLPGRPRVVDQAPSGKGLRGGKEKHGSC